jgi:hypothetical protein
LILDSSIAAEGVSVSHSSTCIRLSPSPTQWLLSGELNAVMDVTGAVGVVVVDRPCLGVTSRAAALRQADRLLNAKLLSPPPLISLEIA